MKKENVICKFCECSFEKSSREVRRSIKLGREQYCSISCSKKDSKNLQHLASIRNSDMSKLNPSNRLDEYSNYREYFRRARRRPKECLISLEDLKEQWESQKGKCPYLDVLLIHRKYKDKGRSDFLTTASLDRIDSSLPYQKGNIEFVSLSMNYMKNDLSKVEFISLLERIQNCLNLILSH